jgi:myo-inositol-1-phosphate synthase
VRDVEVVAAFDVAATKVGRDVGEAIFAPPNNTARFASVAPTGVRVVRGPTLDGIGRYMQDLELAPDEPVDVAGELVRTGTQVLVSYLPVGSQQASEFYAEQALAAGCALVNCMPTFIASDATWSGRFAERGLPLVGDDVKSQRGATIVHRALASLFRERGVRLERTYQLNVGGNADFKNMLERERLVTKKLSKTRAVVSVLDHELPTDDIHIGPSDFVPWLGDRKTAFIHLEGTGFGGMALSVEVKLEVWDSPNSAGVVIDAVRCAKLAMDRGIGGALVGPSGYYMKSPPEQMTDEEARVRTQAFIEGRE